MTKNQREVKEIDRRYIDVIHEILAFVFPDFVIRRGWTESFIREFYFKAIARAVASFLLTYVLESGIYLRGPSMNRAEF